MQRKLEEIFEDWSVVSEDLDELNIDNPLRVVTIERVWWDGGLQVEFEPLDLDDETVEKVEKIRQRLLEYWEEKLLDLPKEIYSKLNEIKLWEV
jgi:hypothetical protein